jgi:hypothetical protein
MKKKFSVEQIVGVLKQPPIPQETNREDPSIWLKALNLVENKGSGSGDGTANASPPLPPECR